MKRTSLSTLSITRAPEPEQVETVDQSRMSDLLFEMQETTTVNRDSSISLRKSIWNLETTVANLIIALQKLAMKADDDDGD